MPITKSIVTLGIDDCKISKLLTDVTTNPTYSTPAQDVPGIQELGFKPNFLSKELRGDEKLMDIWSKLESLEFNVSHAQIDLDVLGTLFGSTVTSSGITPNQLNTLSIKGADLPNYFKIEGQIKYTGGAVGDEHLVLYKCKINNLSINYKTQEHAIVSFSGKAIPCISNDKTGAIIINESATAIS